MALVYRADKEAALTITEVDGNFRHFASSHDVSGSITVTGSVYMEQLKLKNNTTTPTVVEGSLMVSGSLLFFGSGSAWHTVTF